MLKVWKAPAYVQTRFIPISFLMRNGTFKWIQLKSYRRYPYDSFFMLKYIMCTSKQNKNENQTSRLGVESRFVKISVFPQNAKTMSYD